MVEGTALEMRRRGNLTESSNLSLSAKIENRNWKPKWGRAAGATQTHYRQKFANPKGLSTLRVAQKVRFGSWRIKNKS